MLQKIRKHYKTIMWTVAILIVPTFVIWNIGSAVKNRQSGYAGSIHNKKILQQDFLQEKIAARNELILRYGAESLQSIDLDEQTWTRLILLHEATQRKLRVSDDELLTHLKSLPLFQMGPLTPQTYTALIAQLFQTSPEIFEKGLKNSLLIQKLITAVTADVGITDADLKNGYLRENEKMTAEAILIAAAPLEAEVSLADEAALKTFYEQQRESFKTLEQVDVEYIAIPLERFKAAAPVSQERIKRYYEHNQSEFMRETTGAESPEEKTPAPVEYKTLEEVRTAIEEKLIAKDMEDQAYTVARQILSHLYSHNDLSAAAAEAGLSVTNTGPFAMAGEIPGIGVNYQFLRAAFSLKKGEISEIIPSATALYLLKPTQKIPPAIPPYEEIADAVKNRYQKEEALRLAEQKARQMRETLQTLLHEKKLPLAEAAQQLMLTATTLSPFSRTGYIREIGFAPELAAAAFSLEPGQLSDVLHSPQGPCILIAGEKTTPSEDQFQQEKDQFRERLLAEKRNEHINAWFEKIKQTANPVSFQREQNQQQ
ncbi:MAG: peptidyl-prolyl cis-trans isomerase [Candidatus Omnitrophica bacterium]|nr:peptidyl-prolyl cis-trans isomerase [Candidatus Omnitrophota bacterium]